MSRVVLTLNTLYVQGSALSFVEADDDGVGNGVEVAHSANAPIVLVVYNHSGDTVIVTVKTNNQTGPQGVDFDDIVTPVGDNSIAVFRCPPDYCTSGGLLQADIDNSSNVGFAAYAETPTVFTNAPS